MTVFDLDSVTSRIVVWKLGFLKRQLTVGAMGVAAVAMRSLLDDPNSLCLVGESRELEEHFGTNYTDTILEGGDEVSMHEVKRGIKQADRVKKLEKCRERAPLIVEIVNKGGSWARLWDSALHLSTRHTCRALSCWHITVMDQIRVLCVTRTTLILTPLDTF